MNNKEKNLFIAYLQSKNIHGKTLKNYVARISHFKKWLNKPVINTQKKDVLNYLQYLQENLKLTPGTRQHALGMLSRYYTFLYENERIEKNPVLLIKLRGTRKKALPKILTLDEMNEFLDTHYHLKVNHAEENKHLHQRNHLILSLFIYQGLRVEEITSLTLGDINLQKATIKIQSTNNSNERTLPLQAVQMGILYEYLEKVRPLFNSKKINNQLLNTKWGFNKLTENLRTIYPKFTKFNQLRTSCITYWIQTEGLRIAQYKAGHRYVSSTEKYLSADIESLQKDINTYHPL